jgi:acetyltransferase-like isoleucine patch superfamily enzyme
MLRNGAKTIALALATLLVLPELLSYVLRRRFLGRDRAFQNSCQLLALVPGTLGQYLRRAFLIRTLRRCHPSVTVEWGACLTKVDAILDKNVYIGPNSHLGLVHVEEEVLVGAGAHVPSGGHMHAFADAETPLREQGGERRLVRLGAGCWIGSAAVVMADVGRNTIVGAGAVVTRPLPDWSIAGGVPARVIKERLRSAEKGEIRQGDLEDQA